MSETHQKIIIGITGASGVMYGVRLLELLKPLPHIETHLVISKTAEVTLAYETQLKTRQLIDLADHHYKNEDMAAAISSGSFQTSGMIIAPCTVKTMSEIATGVTTSLISRAADVCLKERRKLAIMIRETPLHLGHLRNLTLLAEYGAIICPPMPAFYNRPVSLDQTITHTAIRTLDLFGIHLNDSIRWGSREDNQENILKIKNHTYK